MLGDETRPSAYLNWSEGEFAWFLTSDADINYALLGRAPTITYPNRLIRVVDGLMTGDDWMVLDQCLSWAYLPAWKPIMGVVSGEVMIGRRMRRGSSSMASMSSSSEMVSLRSRYGLALGLRQEKRLSMPASETRFLSSSLDI